ncbi:MAG: hypothetical protein V3575_00415 [Candidatus Absconditabacteria bacterium]
MMKIYIQLEIITMRIEEYFNHIKEIKTTDAQKMRIYQSILLGGNKKSILTRSTFYWKVSTYTILLIFLWGVFFGPIIKIGENEDKINYSYLSGGFLIEEKPQYTLNQVLADYIGEIIEVEGEIQVLKDGKEIKTDKIYDGDTILLLNSAQIKFMVNDGIKATIIGPAKFDVKFLGETDGVKNFVINLVYGDYFEVKSEETSNDNIIIQTKDFQIESKNTNNQMDLKITTDGEKKILENRGSDIVVKKVVDDEKTYTSIKSNQIAEVNDEVKILQEIKTLTEQLTTKKVEESYEIENSTDLSIPNSYLNDESYQSNITTLENNLSEAFTGENDINFVPGKKVLDTNKSEQLKKILSSSFLKKDIENLVLEYLKGNESGYKISYNNLYQRITKVLEIHDLEIHSEIIKLNMKGNKSEISDLVTICDQLIAKLNENYHVPPQYMGRLNVLLGWLVILNGKEFGLFKTDKDTLDFDSVFDKLNLTKSKSNLEIK